MAACLKGFYLHQAALGVNRELGQQLSLFRLPTRADRERALLGHLTRELPSNPLAPRRGRRRHPKMLPEGARARLAEAVLSARDRLVVIWLADAGFRIGELCGLHLADLHLLEKAACGECRSPHVHVCHRDANPNQARAKTGYPWCVENGTVRGGLIKRVSPAMIHTYFEYMTTEYPRQAGHGMLLVQLHGPGHDGRGRPRPPGGCSAGRVSGRAWAGSAPTNSGIPSPLPFSMPPTATCWWLGMRAGGLPPRWSMRSTRTSTFTIRSSSGPCARSGDNHEHGAVRPSSP